MLGGLGPELLCGVDRSHRATDRRLLKTPPSKNQDLGKGRMNAGAQGSGLRNGGVPGSTAGRGTLMDAPEAILANDDTLEQDRLGIGTHVVIRAIDTLSDDILGLPRIPGERGLAVATSHDLRAKSLDIGNMFLISRSPPRSVPSRPRTPTPPLNDNPMDKARRTVFCNQLSAQVTKRDLEDFFRNCGRVRGIKMVEDRISRRSKGIAYVEFYKENAVAKAISCTGAMLFGIPIAVQATEAEKNGTIMEVEYTKNNDPVSNKLFVESLSSLITEKDLNDLFEPFGKVDSVNLHVDAATGQSKGYAFVQYKHTYDARDAIKNMNNFELMGKKVP